jgi:hypothetical protein
MIKENREAAADQKKDEEDVRKMRPADPDGKPRGAPLGAATVMPATGDTAE